jgi:hypothetical protein
VVGHGDGTAGALGVPDSPILIERPGTLDGRLVDALRAVQLVRAAIGCDAADLCGARRWVVGAEVLDYVVLDERVSGPAVDGKVRVAVGVVVGRVVDDPVPSVRGAHGLARTGPSSGCLPVRRARVPSLSADPVAVAGPGGAVLTAGLVGVPDASGTVGPEREVVPVMGAGGAAAVCLALLETGHLTGECKHPGDSGSGSEKGGEGDHLD